MEELDQSTNEVIETQEQIETPEIQDVEIEQKEEQEETKPFSIDDIDFGDTYKVGDYDLSKYKDVIPEDSLSALDERAKEYADKGFTQEQIEFLIDKEIEESKPNPEQVMKELNKHLSVEEKRNYKAVGSELKNILETNGLGKYYEEAMANPIVYKIINSVMNIKRGADIKARTETESRRKTMTGYEGVEIFNKYLKENLGNTNIPAKKKEILAMLDDEGKKYFNEIVVG